MSDLLAVRTKFIDQSGLYDLAVDPAGGDYSDDGADWFINAGQRFLDGMLDHPKDLAEVSATLSQGETTLEFDRVRAVQEVYLSLSDTDKYLDRLFIQELREQFDKDASQDEPTHFAVDILRDGSQTQAHFEKKGIALQPPADGTYTVVVKGKFYSPELSADGDQSFWTLRHPDMLVQAAMYSYEEKYRNRSGMQDHLTSIRARMEQIDNDVVEEEIAGADQLADAWNHRDRRSKGFS